jgi:hypothetical protein
LLNSLQMRFSIIAAGRRVVGAFIELGRFSRKLLFESLSLFNIRTLLNHFGCPQLRGNRHQLSRCQSKGSYFKRRAVIFHYCFTDAISHETRANRP